MLKHATNHIQQHCTQLMKHLIYIFILLFFIQSNGQNTSETSFLRLDLLILEKTTKDTLVASIVELYSGEQKIETDLSDLVGKSILIVNSKDIIDNKILLKIYGRKCKPFETELI
ncbi:hypothetical protein AST99_11400 [Formosa algae]|nr:hypothetical protein AST99_11400 [Formosa algae]